MKPLDDELRSVLRRVEPPEGFAERVLARARMEENSRRTLGESLKAFLRFPAVRWAMACGLGCFLTVFAVQRYREQQRARHQGELAGAQARIALQIASAKLNSALRDVARPDRHRTEN
jgi:hypothetical protein